MADNDPIQIRHNRIQRDYYENRTEEQNWRMLPEVSPYILSHVQRVAQSRMLDGGKRILDVGCGMGKFTIPLAILGLPMEGLDLSSYLLEKLNECSPEELSIPTHCVDILSPPPSLQGQFDVITGFFMLHHLIDLRQAFLGMKQLLHDEGRMVFVDVNPWCPLYYLQIFLSPSMRWRAEKGILNLTDHQIEAAVTQAGFSQVTIDNYGILPPPLKNRRLGDWVERQFDRVNIFKPVAAFKLITAQLA